MQGGARAEKQRIRQEVQAVSSQLTPEYRKEASEAITRQILSHPWWKQAKTVMIYWSLPQEPDTRELMETALREGKTLLLPRCLDGKQMTALPLRDLNAFGAQMVNSGAVASLRYVDDPLEYPNIQYFFRVQNTFPVSASTSNFLFDYFVEK